MLLFILMGARLRPGVAKSPGRCHLVKAGLGPKFGGPQVWPVSAHLWMRGKLEGTRDEKGFLDEGS